MHVWISYEYEYSSRDYLIFALALRKTSGKHRHNQSKIDSKLERSVEAWFISLLLDDASLNVTIGYELDKLLGILEGAEMNRFTLDT